MRRKIAQILEEKINPYVAGHGGRIEVVDYVNGVVYLNMSGGCQGCAASAMTVRQGVEEALRQALGDRIKGVVDVTDHASGSNPYYSA
jgi:Fe-S cluster biogenesis protein NfuA